MSIKVLPYQLKRQISEIKMNYFFPSLKELKGNVLEIGCGKGENFEYYRKECKVWAIDKKIKSNLPKEGENQDNSRIFIKKANAERLPFKNDYFDAVTASFVFCSVNSAKDAIQEVRRVLRRGGKFIILEHIKSNKKSIFIVQKILTRILGLLSFECHLDRDPRDFIQNDSFQIVREKVHSNSIEPYLYLEAIKR